MIEVGEIASGAETVLVTARPWPHTLRIRKSLQSCSNSPQRTHISDRRVAFA